MNLYAHLLLLMLWPALFFNSSNHFNAFNTTNEKDDSASKKILIINAFDIGSVTARKNKKDLFHQLTDTVKHMLADELQKKSNRYPLSLNRVLFISTRAIAR